MFDPRKVSYTKLLDVFWHNVDPFAIDQQFCDHGDQYRSAIFTSGPEQARLAAERSTCLRLRVVSTSPSSPDWAVPRPFYPAEGYHQDYYQKNPLRYKFYRYNCGRDGGLSRSGAVPGIDQSSRLRDSASEPAE